MYYVTLSGHARFTLSRTAGAGPATFRPDSHCGAFRFLLGWFSLSGTRSIAAYGLDLVRIAAFIAATVQCGGTVAGCTLALPAWIELFSADSDAVFLITGMAYGIDFEFACGYDSEPFHEANYVDADHRERVHTQIMREVAQGRIVRALPGYIGISALGSVLKGAGPKVRVIHDYSRPRVGGVNAAITVRKETFSRVMDAAAMLRIGAFHCKVDITEAYRSFPMAPAWWTRHVFEWDGVIYSDLRMPFGNAGAPSAFHRFSAAFARAIRARGFGVVPYLDDFWLTA